MYVVLDSNIWFSELGLGTAQGAALQFFVKAQNAVIAVPEVVKREVEFNLIKTLSENCDAIEKNHRQLLSIFRKLKAVVLPSRDEIAEQVSQLFQSINAEVFELPFTLQSATASLDKVIAGLPPSGPKNQQFKDGVVWADCLTLLADRDVALVTDDKGFYRDRQYENGLASNLKRELADKPNTLRIYSDLNALLNALRQPIEIDETVLVREFSQSTRDSMERILEVNGFAVTGSPVVDRSFYITENPDNLYIDFSIAFECEDITGADRSEARLTLNGDAYYHPAEKSFTDFRNKGEELTFTDSDGQQEKRHVVIMVGNVIIGHRTVEHTVRQKVD
jgi:hypothetical protein